MNSKYFDQTNSTILITGATGFIGGLLVEELIRVNQFFQAGIKLILPVRNLKKARERFPINDKKYECIYLIESSMEDFRINQINKPIDYIFHCASVTTSSIMISDPVKVADGIVLGTKNILELAREKKVKSMVYLSSMEVYGVIDSNTELVTENMLGNLELFSARSCYPLGKRMAEHYCYIYFKQFGVPVKIARLAQTFGCGISKEDNRVFAQFARAAIKNENIVLHTRGLSMGNYCESKDAIRGLFTILEKGQDGEAYNIVNEESTMKICDMAKLVADKIAKGNIKIVYNISENHDFGYAKNTKLRLSAAKLRNLGWKPTKGLEEMYRDLIHWWGYNC